MAEDNSQELLSVMPAEAFINLGVMPKASPPSMAFSAM
jgi:hypothetical protein